MIDPGLRSRVHAGVIERLGGRLLGEAPESLAGAVRREIDTLVAADPAAPLGVERTRLVEDLVDDVIGLGPLEPLLADPGITEIMVNGATQLFVERGGRIEALDAAFASDAHLRRVIDRIVSPLGRRIDEASPLVDARLPDGSRVNAIIPPLSVDGPALTIRKFSREVLSIEDLVSSGAATPAVAEFLHAAVATGLNVVISGGTGTGKTTLLNILSGFVPFDERIVTIEDAVELRLLQDHVVRLESRPPNLEGAGEVTVRDLVRNALRMRPDRIVVGEVRGSEALDMLQAMNTGHDGSLSTVHCNSPRDALSRLETMVLMAGLDLPSRAIREQIAAAIDLIVHVRRWRDGHRGISQVTEVGGLEGTTITTSDLYVVDGERRLVPTGVRPGCAPRLGEAGFELPSEMLAGPVAAHW